MTGVTLGPGARVDRRYKLTRFEARTGPVQTWLGHDELLNRPVTIHLMRAEEPRALEILDEARRMAPVLDARFVHVLDAVLAEWEPYSYVVCEHCPGQSFTAVLAEGPLEPLEACWAVQEVADALAAIHAGGLAHRHLSTDVVVLMPSGRVKVQAFCLNAALEATPADARSGLAHDVEALGELLDTCLGQAARPTSLDAIVTGIADGRLATASAVADALEGALEGGELDGDEITAGTPARPALSVVGGSTEEPGSVEELGSVAGPGVPAERPAFQRGRPDADHPLDAESTSPPDQSASDGSNPDASADATPRTPPPPSARRDRPGGEPPKRSPGQDAPRSRLATRPPGEEARRRGVSPAASPEHAALVTSPGKIHRFTLVLVLAFVLALVIGLGGVFVDTYDRSHGTRPTPSAPATSPGAGASDPAGQPIAIAGVRVFDPAADGGDEHENDPLVRLATDGRDDTSWVTERYGRSATFNGRKPGVGVLIDLGDFHQVKSVDVTLTGGATDLSLRVPAPAAVDQPPLESVRDWQEIVVAPSATRRVTLSLPTPVRTRYLLVYVTKMPALSAGGYQASIAEIRVSA